MNPFTPEAPVLVDPRTLPVRFSRLKLMAQSPLHYFHACQVEMKDSLPMRIGRGVHSFLLDMPDRVALWTGKVRNGKAWEEFQARHGECEILNQREFELANSTADAIRKHPEARRLLFGGTTMEHLFHWQFMGRQCRSTPDAFGDSHVVDLKTCRSADPFRFVQAATWMHYHAQLAFYMEGLRTAGLANPTEAYIVAVESAPPHPVTVLRLTERALDMGARSMRVWMERLLVCERADEWPGYTQAVVDFDVMTSDGLVIGEMDDDEEEAA